MASRTLTKQEIQHRNLGDWAFEAKRIPGSINISNMQALKKAMHEKMLDPDDEIIIHCSNPLCPASIIGYQIFERNGYKNVRRYPGGIQDWVPSMGWR